MKQRLPACVIGLGLGLSSVAWADDEVTGLSPASEPSPWRSSLGMGAATVAADASSTPLEAGSGAGLAFQWRKGRLVSDSVRLQVGTSVVFSEPERTLMLWETGVELGQWTTQAYRDVYAWSMDEEGLSIVRIPASMVAYGLLMVAYSGSALLFMGGPIAAISFTSLDATASVHLLEPGHGPFLEAGLGLMGHWLPDSPTQEGGAGPVLGLGWEREHLTVGTRLFWSPRSDGEIRSIVDWHMTAATFSVAVAR